MTELDKLEKYLQDNHVDYIRRALFQEEPEGPGMIAVYKDGVQRWNAIHDPRIYGGRLEHTGWITESHDGKTGIHSAAELIEMMEQERSGRAAEQREIKPSDEVREIVQSITGCNPVAISPGEHDRIMEIYRLKEMNMITEEMVLSFVKAGKCIEEVLAEIHRLSEVMPDPICLIRQAQEEESNNALKMHGYPMVRRKRYKHQSKR